MRAHRRREVLRRIALAGRLAGQLDVLQDAVDVRRVDSQDRQIEVAQLVDGVLRRAAVRADDDEVRIEANDLLDVDALIGGDDRDIGRLGRVIGDVVDLAHNAVARAQREQRLSLAGHERDDLLRLGLDGDCLAVVTGQRDWESRGDRRTRARCRTGRGR